MSNDEDLNDKIIKLIQFNTQELRFLQSIKEFYKSLQCVHDFISIIKSESNISIRLIDYFVTKYSKKNKIVYKLDDDLFNVYQSYKQQLKNYQKKNFDPFARGIKIPYYIDNYWIITTIGQLHFFKWFISKNIYDFVLKNRENIELDLKKNKKNINKNKIKKSKKNNKTENKLFNNNISMTNNIIEPKIRDIILVSF
jgi:hypothetical protein